MCSYRSHPNSDHWSGDADDREPIRFGTHTDRDGEEVLGRSFSLNFPLKTNVVECSRTHLFYLNTILARNRVTPPLDGSSPPLPARPYDVATTAAVTPTVGGGARRTTVEDGA